MNADFIHDDQRFDDIHTNQEKKHNESIQKFVQTESKLISEEANSINSFNEAGNNDDWVTAQSHLISNLPVEQKIIDQNKGGLLVEFGNLQGFLPNSQMPELKNISQSNQAFEFKRRMIGTMMRLLVIEVDKKRNRLIFSAKFGREDQSYSQLAGLNIGQTMSAKVVNLVQFGAFVDLGRGTNGLVHISELFWQRINHPSEIMKIGDEITVTVQEIDLDRNRVSLSRKALQPNPWLEIEGRYKVGDLVEGQITSIRPFGIFLKLATGVEGLLYESEYSNDGQATLRDSAKPGEKILVRIISIQPDQQRISLSLQQVTMEEQLTWNMHRDQLVAQRVISISSDDINRKTYTSEEIT
ncbi:MAG: 30S ribosomal protein S1 [Anaerolineales bacterium]|nr:30S ribosomal protein S1 [Chloroflexota bacterium]MBL6981764.1 30S ribosomal protein S1 [Anaerolineales bacterium]